MALFFVSLFLTVLTAFFITSVLEQKNFIKIFIYFTLIMGANIVLAVEILSLFSAISAGRILLLNLITALVSSYFWVKNKKPCFEIHPVPFFSNIWKTVLKDKYLLVLGAGFAFMVAISLFLISFMPVSNIDASAYHVLRSTLWIFNKNFSHSLIADIRNIVMPIDSEILYLWVLVFLKKTLWFGMFSFIGFMMAISSLYGILTNMKFSQRRKLWVLLILSSLPSVIILSSGTETDMIIAGLVSSSIYLFWEFLKDKKISTVCFSTLAYALAIGTKTTSFFFAPALCVWFGCMAYVYFKKDFYKPLLKFAAFFIVHFLVFSSYNYILNFQEFGNIMGQVGFSLAHKNLYGFKGMCASFIKTIFMFFDFSGFTWNATLGKLVLIVRDNILQLFALGTIPDGVNSGDTSVSNRSLLEPLVGMGILGFLTVLPCFVISLVKPVFRRGKRELLIFSFAMILLITIMTMALGLVHMAYNIRFLTSFCVVSAPLLAYSYGRKNSFCKFVITFFALFGFFLISTHIWARPFGRIVNYLKSGASISEIRYAAQCSMLGRKYPPSPHALYAPDCLIAKKIKEYSPSNKILYFSTSAEELLNIKMLEFLGYDIDFSSIEDIKSIDFDNYNMIIIRNNRQSKTHVTHPYHAPYYMDVSGAPCRYYTTKYKGKSYVGVVSCELTEQFFDEHNFKQIFTKDLTARNAELELQRYYFYENQNNPIIKK